MDETGRSIVDHFRRWVGSRRCCGTVRAMRQFRQETYPGRVLVALSRKCSSDAEGGTRGAVTVKTLGPVAKPATLARLAVRAYLPAGHRAKVGSTCAAAGGTFEAAVDALFLTPSRAVETPG